MNEEKCYVCLRITPEYVLKMAHKLWTDPKFARETGLEASRIIEATYRKAPVFFCHKTANGVLSGLFYILGVTKNEYMTQREIADALNITETTVRKSYHEWAKRTDLGIRCQQPHLGEPG